MKIGDRGKRKDNGWVGEIRETSAESVYFLPDGGNIGQWVKNDCVELENESHPIQAHIEHLPVYLNNQCCLVVQKFLMTDGLLSDLFMWEYHDVMKDTDFAAKQLVKSFEEQCSIRFLQCLRKACADQIQRQNKKYGTNHSLDSED